MRLPKKRKVTIGDEYGDVVCKVKWSKFRLATMRLNKDVEMRVKDWLLYDKEMQCVLRFDSIQK